MNNLISAALHFERHGYFFAKKFLVLAPVALARSFKTQTSRKFKALQRHVFQNLAQGGGLSRAIRQQANMRVMKNMPVRSGFIALITAIILSVILLTVATALNETGFLTRSEVLDSEYKDRSSALAEGCVDTAMLNLANDPSYTVATPTSVSIGSDACSIDVVTPGSPNTIIVTHANFPSANGAVTRLNIVVDSGNLSVVSWVEAP